MCCITKQLLQVSLELRASYVLMHYNPKPYMRKTAVIIRGKRFKQLSNKDCIQSNVLYL